MLPADAPSPRPVEFLRRLTSAFTSFGSSNDLGGGPSESNEAPLLPEFYLYTWGCNEFGQLLNGSVQRGEGALGCLPSLVEKMLYHRIHSVICGADSSWILDENGAIFVGGLNSQKQLVDDETLVEISKPLFLEMFPNARCVSSGRDHSVVALESGAALSFGVNEFGQLGHSESTSIYPVTARKMPVKGVEHPFVNQAACGHCHTLILTGTGEVLACGDASLGCLGCGALYTQSLPVLQRVPSLYAIPVKTVCTGAYHSMALTVCGHLYTWGRNKELQLGLGINYVGMSSVDTPIKVDYLSNIRSIAAGASHSACIVSGGVLYLCGTNAYGELGRGDSIFERSPTFLQCKLLDKKIRGCTLGSNFTVVRTSDGQLYAWGRNDVLQLGCTMDVPHSDRAVQVDVPNKEQMFFIALSAGDAHVMALAVPRRSLSTMSGALPRRDSHTLKADVAMTLSSSNLKRLLSSTLVNPNPTSLHDAFPTFFLSGASVEEILSLVESSRSTLNDTLLRHRLLPILADAHRLNCSFVYPGRGLHSDFQGLDDIFQVLPESLQMNVLLSFLSCLQQAEPYVQYLESAEQTRFLLMILQCPLLHEQSIPSNRQILYRLAKIVVQMPLKGKEVLVHLVADYPNDIFQTRIVENVKSFITASLLLEISNYQYSDPVWNGVALLSLLVFANKLRSEKVERVADQYDLAHVGESFSIPEEHFYLDCLTDLLNPINEIIGRDALISQRTSDHIDDLWLRETFSPKDSLLINGKIPVSYRFFISHFHICPLKFKRIVIKLESLIKQERIGIESLYHHTPPFYIIEVNRENLLEEATTALNTAPVRDLLKPIKIKFAGEEGVDQGGLLKEFFTLVCKQMSDPAFGMFIYNEDTRTIWFNKDCVGKEKEFFALGSLLGIGLLNDILISLSFPQVLFNKLQGAPVTLHDLRDVYPDECQSFYSLLNMTDAHAFREAFSEVTFEIAYKQNDELKTLELMENGSHVPLTFENRQEFVERYVNYLLVHSVEDAFAKFKEGFSRFSSSLLKSLSGKELGMLLCGNPELNFDELQEGTTYEGYTADEAYIHEFWRIVKSLSIFEKQKFLKFVTGSDRAPLFGLKEISLKIQKNGMDPTNRLPTAYTCFNCLLLPYYQTTAKLERLLLLAIENSEGFGLN